MVSNRETLGFFFEGEESADERVDLDRRRRRKPAPRGGNRERSGDVGGTAIPTPSNTAGVSSDKTYERLAPDDEPTSIGGNAAQSMPVAKSAQAGHADRVRAQRGGNPTQTRDVRSSDYGESEEGSEPDFKGMIRLSGGDNDVAKYYKPLTLRARLTVALTADADELRFQLEELHAVRQIMIEGNSQMVARLMLQLHVGELDMHHPWLRDYMKTKLVSVQRGRGRVVLDKHELGALEDEIWPTAQPGAVDRAKGLENIVNTYCRSSTASIMAMGIEIAKIKNVLAMKEALNLKLLGLAGSVVYLFGQWLFDRCEYDGFDSSHA